MITRSFRTAIVAATLGIAAMGVTTGAASAKPIFPKGPGKIVMPHKFPKPHGPHWHGHGKWGYGPGIGLGLGLAAVGLAGAYGAYADDCYMKRVVTVYGDVFYRKVCY
jgi:hypothetical protein